MRRAAALFIGGFLSLALVAPPVVRAQAPSKEQQDAIRSNCRSDFLSLCSGVPRGGREALECLVRNQPKLSAGCRSAVNAAIPAPAPAAKAEPKPEAKPAQSEPKPTAQPAPRSESKTEPKAEPKPQATAAPSPAKPAAQDKPTPAAKSVPAPKAAAAPARPTPPKVPQAAAPAAVPPPAAAPSAAKPTAASEAALIRRSCFTDFRVLCKGVQIGQGRALKCLGDNRHALSPSCREAMTRTGN